MPSSCYSAAKSCPTLCNPMDGSMTGFPVLQYAALFLFYVICVNGITGQMLIFKDK